MHTSLGLLIYKECSASNDSIGDMCEKIYS